MPRVQQFSNLGSVGVLKPCCTTRCVHTRASAISRRTSSWLDCQTQRPVMQRARTLRCAGLRALARCTTRSARSTCMKHGTPSQANRGPKNPGRSVRLLRPSCPKPCWANSRAAYAVSFNRQNCPRTPTALVRGSFDRGGWRFGTYILRRLGKRNCRQDKWKSRAPERHVAKKSFADQISTRSIRDRFNFSPPSPIR